LRLLVKAGLGELLDSVAGATARPFPAELFNTPLPWRLGLR
jgi:hypothetical protein